MSDELTFRLRRIRAAIASNEDPDLGKFPAQVFIGKNFRLVSQDFRDGQSDEQIANRANNLIHSIANLRDNLIHWAKAHGKSPQRVWDTFRASFPIRVIMDLSNVDKHGYPLDRGSASGRDPKLVDADSVLSIKGGTPGRWSGVRADPATGRLHKFGDGAAAVIITGQVVDKDGVVLGDLWSIGLQAVTDWEALLTEYGVCLNGCGLVE